MASEHLPQQGSQFYVSTDNSSFTEITEIKSVTPPPLSRDASDDTPLNATVEISTPGVLKKITQAKFSFFLHKTLLATLIGYSNSSTNPLYWRVTLPKLSSESTNGSRIEWQGWMKTITWSEIAVGASKVMVDFEIERTTIAAVTAGS